MRIGWDTKRGTRVTSPIRQLVRCKPLLSVSMVDLLALSNIVLADVHETIALNKSQTLAVAVALVRRAAVLVANCV